MEARTCAIHHVVRKCAVQRGLDSIRQAHCAQAPADWHHHALRHWTHEGSCESTASEDETWLDGHGDDVLVTVTSSELLGV